MNAARGGMIVGRVHRKRGRMLMLTIACVTFRMVRLFGGLGFKPGFGGHVSKPGARSCHRAALPLRSVAGY